VSDTSLHIIGGFLAGGVERFVVDLAIHLKELGNRAEVLSVVSRSDLAGEEMKRRLEARGIHYVVGPTERFGLRSARWLANALRKAESHIVHIHGEWPEYAFYMATLFGKAPDGRVIVRTVHNSRMPSQWRIRWAFKQTRASATVYCGDHAAKILGDSRSKFDCVILNGVDFEWPIRSDKSHRGSQEALGLDPALKHFVNVASLRGTSVAASQKAHNVLIDAWRLANMKEKLSCLHLLGEGALRGQLESLASGDKSVQFHGVVPNVHDWLLAGDTFVMPSRWEGLPIAGIEAAGTGIFCIFSRIPSLVELAAPGVYYVTPDDADALAESLTLRSGRNEGPPEVEIEAFRRRYDIRVAATKYFDLYSRL